MDEQMRDVKLSTDEISGLLDLLKIDHGDPDDFEPECPGCIAFQKLTAALSQPAAQEVEWIVWAGGDCPLPPTTLIEAKYRSGVVRKCRTGDSQSRRWDHLGFEGDIVSYRVIKATP